MSHIVKIEAQILSEVAVQSACRRLQLEPAQHGTFDLYNKTVSGLGVELDDWLYPIVVDLKTGDVELDNFDGRWGDYQGFESFLQMYTVEAALIAARKQGHSVREQQLDNGSIKLTVTVGGEA